MSTESSYNLQQSLYSLYRDYYHCGKCTLLKQSDFDHGTYQIKTGGLYVICEDIIFNPDAQYLTSNTEYSENKAYAMGYFAAIAIECDNVIIDLQGFTIRQSYEHYFTQRFFNVIELASSPFITAQGPALVNQATGAGYGYKAANHCMIINGTIGLSSHGAVHGNNNTNILLEKLSVVDFESCGIQLNGVCNAFIDCVTITGISIAPVRSLTFTMLQHLKTLQEHVATGTGNATYDVMLHYGTTTTLHRDTIITNLNAMAEALKCPFKEADANHSVSTTPPSTTVAIRTIWNKLQTITTRTCEDGVDNIPEEVTRFVAPVCVDTKDGTTIAPPDGSAMYGILIHESGVAISELADGCAKNGGVCCPMQKNTQSSCRGSNDVTINNCVISNINLRAQETLGLFKETFIRDLTSSVLDLATIIPGSFLEQARVFVNATQTNSWELPIQLLLLYGRANNEYPYSTFISECTNIKFKYNIDLMAHVSKGVFGLRLEDTNGLCVENVTVKDVQNNSEVIYPRIQYALPKTAIVESHISSPLDQTSDYAYGGADARGVFIGNCRGYLLTQITVNNVCCAQGVCNGVDISQSINGHIHVLQTSKLSGLITDTVHVHNNCQMLHLREIHNNTKNIEMYRTFLENILKDVDGVDGTTTEEQKKGVFKKLTALLRIPSVDNNLLAYESPASIAQLRLC